LYSSKNFLGKRHSSKRSYVWLTYEEVKDYSFYLAKAIIERDFYTKTKEGYRIFGVCSKTCPEATILDFVTFHAELTTVNIDYALCDTADENSLQMLDLEDRNQFKNTVEKYKLTTMFGSTDTLKTIIRLKMSNELECLKYFICFDDLNMEMEAEKNQLKDLEVININTLINYGSELNIDVIKPSKDSTMCICSQFQQFLIFFFIVNNSPYDMWPNWKSMEKRSDTQAK
jgi:long-subunit acyl-CoA synthetase (AMP-forming)